VKTEELEQSTACGKNRKKGWGDEVEQTNGDEIEQSNGEQVM
jgi:hypothetical protein